jgi:hypothetical protein
MESRIEVNFDDEPEDELGRDEIDNRVPPGGMAHAACASNECALPSRVYDRHAIMILVADRSTAERAIHPLYVPVRGRRMLVARLERLTASQTHPTKPNFSSPPWK